MLQKINFLLVLKFFQQIFRIFQNFSNWKTTSLTTLLLKKKLLFQLFSFCSNCRKNFILTNLITLWKFMGEKFHILWVLDVLDRKSFAIKIFMKQWKVERTNYSFRNMLQIYYINNHWGLLKNYVTLRDLQVECKKCKKILKKSPKQLWKSPSRILILNSYQWKLLSHVYYRLFDDDWWCFIRDFCHNLIEIEVLNNNRK